MNLLERLNEQTQYPPSWSYADEGDTVEGTITRYTRAPTRFGECWVCWLRTAEGPVAVWISSAVLAGEFKRLKPRVGERIAIKALGWSDDRRYRKFAVVVDRPEEQPDFDSFAEPETMDAYAYAAATGARPKPPPPTPRRRPAGVDLNDPFNE